MNTKIFLLGFFLCLCLVDARHFNEQSEQTEEEQSNTNRRENGHRRKRYHMSYGYDYTPPGNPFNPYGGNRRDYDRSQDLLPEIFRLLDEISAYVRRPPPPPQPIYIPYAVPYPIYSCPASQPPQPNVNITSRFPSMDDTNQNWGLVDDGYDEEEGDGTRPLSFTPIQPKRKMTRPPVALDHGTQHARAPSAPAASAVRPHVPDMCEVFALSCCSGAPAQQRKCFADAGCGNTYNNGKGCDQERLLKIIDDYSKAYAPMQ